MRVTLAEYARLSGIDKASLTRRIKEGTQKIEIVPFSEFNITEADAGLLRAIAAAKEAGQDGLRMIDTSKFPPGRRAPGRPKISGT